MLQNFKSGAPVNNFPEGDVTTLKAGTYDLLVKSIHFTNDRMQSLKSPVRKANEPEWKDVTEQLAVVFWNKSGVSVRRFNATGYVRYSEIPDNKKHLFDELGTEGYAVSRKTGERRVDADRTEKAINIINQFFAACGLPEGSEPADLVGCEVRGTVTAKVWGTSTFYELTKFESMTSASVVVTEEVTTEEEDY